MGVYSKLLLSAGGGIVSLQQQADQEPNAANVLIGLGGTGVDCIRTIKTQVHSRLKPDDPEAIVPAYDHIRFLGVDTDPKSAGIVGSDEEQRADSLLALSDTEFFSIANAHVKKDLSRDHWRSLADLRELNWLRYEDIKAGDLTLAGAGGIRQIGRYMLMSKSAKFLNRIEQEINTAKSGLTNPSVNVHIFSGLSGGTGAGTFLDVCYMVNHVANRIGNVTVFGYFFLPDVNLSRIPSSLDDVQSYVCRNGYAAMQELDYCMQLAENGGSFIQDYQGTRIEWHKPPVELCHLVCATDTNNNVRPKAYEYAMNVTAEYVMDLLTKSEGFTLTSHLSNFRQMVSTADGDKQYGFNLNYCVLGAACASLPLREVNTYLASALFGKFAGVRDSLPSKGDVEGFAMVALGRRTDADISALYDCLVNEMQQNVNFVFEDYGDDYRLALQDGGKSLHDHYIGLRSKEEGTAEKNAKSMQNVDNEESLINRVHTALEVIIKKIDLGPNFAYGMLSKAQSHNLINIIDGLIAENRGNWEYISYNRGRKYDFYESARNNFHHQVKRSFMDNDRKRFADLKAALVDFETHKLYETCYKLMNDTLCVLKNQVEEAAAHKYARLARVTANLVDTFKENADVLATERQATLEDSFAMPLMSIDELKKSMDAEISKVSKAGMFDALMSALLENKAAWLQEDEDRICKTVTKFFVETAFGDFASRSITSFLKDKYDTDNNEELTNRVYQEWMKTLKERARPLFYFNRSVWREDKASTMASLSVPDTSEPVRRAAEMLNRIDEEYKIKVSALTDRIYMMSCSAALPLAAYNNCDEYERMYFEVTPTPGTHYYEGKPVPDMAFDDWRKLPPLTPQSLVSDRAPHQVRQNLREAQGLFEQAKSEGLLDVTDMNRTIMQPTEESIQSLKDAAATCERIAAVLKQPNQIPEAERALSELEAASRLEIVPSGMSFAEGGPADPEVMERMLEDLFVYAPTYQITIRQYLDRIEEARTAADVAKKKLDDCIQVVGVGSQDAADFRKALFTGVISFEGAVVVYHYTEYGIANDITLSSFGPEYPYAMIPVYQAFVSYKELDPAVKDAIRTKSNELLNSMSPQIQETCSGLKKIIVDDRINAWAQQSRNFRESEEMIQFLGTLNSEFKTFCAGLLF